MMKRVVQLVDAFSRPAPFPPNKDAPKLITITFSHYCEKARWALDLSPLRHDYIEDNHAPMLHYKPAMRASKGAGSSTPLLVYRGEGGDMLLQDSTAILRHLALEHFPREMGYLFPPHLEQEVSRWEADLDDRLGPHARRLAYWHILTNPDKAALHRAFARNSPRIEALLAPMLAGKAGPLLMKHLGINEESSRESLRVCREIFTKVSRTIEADGRRYLCGDTDKLTAADLTFAALSYIIICPPQCDSLCVSLADVPPSFRELVEEFRQTSAGQLVLRLYEQERYLSEDGWPASPPGKVKIRASTQRDRIPWQLPAATAAVAVAAGAGLRGGGFL